MDEHGNINSEMWLRLHTDLTAHDVVLFQEMRWVHMTQQAAEKLHLDSKRKKD